jgi:outer membrane lipoprotein SlyB
MEAVSLPAMSENREEKEALASAGYTSARGMVKFCALLAVVGALFGSVVFAILWNVAFPGTPAEASTTIGALAGAVFGVLLAVVKVRHGNLEARELVEDRQWRRLLRRQRIDRTP